MKDDDKEMPLVVSYCNMFELAWSTANVIDKSGYQCSVWKPVLGKNEFCLGYLITPEKNYPSNRFLVIVKKGGSDPDAFKRPLGFECKWSTKFIDPNTQKYGAFYKPVPPKGYAVLGDLAIYKKKSQTITLDDFPKVVCVKKEYVDRYAAVLPPQNAEGPVFFKPPSTFPHPPPPPFSQTNPHPSTLSLPQATNYSNEA